MPSEKYTAFAGFLEHGAENAYPEGWQENEHASPDAVQIMTVHQAKGMQWPVVFVPALLKNRFPAKKPGGRTEWHLLPREGVKRQARFEGTIEDERRLFYVAMTRSQKFLHFTWAPVPGHRWFQLQSEFWDDILVSKYVKRKRSDYSARKRLAPQPRRGVANVVFSFSELKYFFECPYQFKLRVLCGFNAPIAPALGYGKSLHDALAEVHARAIRGDFVDVAEVPNLVNTHLHTPYASTKLRKDLEGAAERVLQHYVQDNAEEFNQIEFFRAESGNSSGEWGRRQWPHRSCAASGYGRDDDRRSKVKFTGASRGGNRSAVAHLRARLSGTHRPTRPTMWRSTSWTNGRKKPALCRFRLHRGCES